MTNLTKCWYRLKDILEVGDDIEIDVPQCWTYLAETIALLLIDLPAEKRKFFLQNIIDMSNPRLKPLLIAKVIHEIAKLTVSNQISLVTVLLWTIYF